MTDRMTGKVVIVTGGARGMGAEHVRRFVEEGAQVVFGDILDDEGEALASELGPDATFVHQDVTSEADWKTIIDTAKDAYGLPTVLVNNAGITSAGGEKPLEDTTKEEFERVLDVNLVSTFLGIRAVTPVMREAGGGSIVNVSSAAGLVGMTDLGAYIASKTGVNGLTKAAAAELGQYGIRVNSVHPGAILTPMTRDIPEVAAMVEPVVNLTPLGRVGVPEEVTSAVLYLSSDDSSFSTGAQFVVDGGFVAV